MLVYNSVAVVVVGWVDGGQKISCRLVLFLFDELCHIVSLLVVVYFFLSVLDETRGSKTNDSDDLDGFENENDS